MKIKPFLVTLFCLLNCSEAIATPQLMKILSEEKTKCENDASIFLAVFPNNQSYVYGERLYSDVQSSFDGQIEALRVAVIKHTKATDIPIDNTLETKISSFRTYVTQLTAPNRRQGNSYTSEPVGGGVPVETITAAAGVITALIPAVKEIIEQIRTSNTEERNAILAELDRLRMRPLKELKADPNLKGNQPTATRLPQINANPITGPWQAPCKIKPAGDYRQYKNSRPEQ